MRAVTFQGGGSCPLLPLLRTPMLLTISHCSQSALLDKIFFPVFSRAVFHGAEASQWSLPARDSRSLGPSPAIWIHRFWKAISLAIGTRCQFRISRHKGEKDWSSDLLRYC